MVRPSAASRLAMPAMRAVPDSLARPTLPLSFISASPAPSCRIPGLRLLIPCASSGRYRKRGPAWRRISGIPRASACARAPAAAAGPHWPAAPGAAGRDWPAHIARCRIGLPDIEESK